jgi:hypothetical protein
MPGVRQGVHQGSFTRRASQPGTRRCRHFLQRSSTQLRPWIDGECFVRQPVEQRKSLAAWIVWTWWCRDD